MYGGLFGDLPSAKKQKTDAAKASNINSKNESKETKGGADAVANADANSNSKTSNPVAAPSAKGNWFAPPRQAPKANKSQFLQMVGNSGTTMAFVPTAALKAKRKKPPAVDSISNSNNNNNNKKSPKPQTDGVDLQSQSSFAAVTTTTITTRVAASKSKSETDPTKPAVIVDIHGTGDINANATDSNKSNNANFAAKPTISPNAEEKMTITITDAYDPYVPNDLLEYWETLAAKKHREKLERDTREALERQKSMQKQLEDERKTLFASGNANGTATARGGGAASAFVGRGRGRGTSNLPAWWVEQQRKEQQGGGGVTGSDHSNSHSSGAGAASPVVTAPSFLGRGRGRGLSNLPAWLVEKQRKESAAANIQ